MDRSQSKLDKQAKDLRKKYDIEVFMIAVDHSSPDVAQKIYDICKSHHFDIDYLINNAEFGGQLRLWTPDGSEYVHDAVNIESPTRLCKRFLPDFIDHGFGNQCIVYSGHNAWSSLSGVLRAPKA